MGLIWSLVRRPVKEWNIDRASRLAAALVVRLADVYRRRVRNTPDANQNIPWEGNSDQTYAHGAEGHTEWFRQIL